MAATARRRGCRPPPHRATVAPPRIFDVNVTWPRVWRRQRATGAVVAARAALRSQRRWVRRRAVPAAVAVAARHPPTTAHHCYAHARALRAITGASRERRRSRTGGHTRAEARARAVLRCRAESRLRAHADGALELVGCLWRRGRWRIKLTTRVRVCGSYGGRRRSAAAMHMRACRWSAVSLVVVFCRRLSRRSRRRRLIADDRRRVAATTAVTPFTAPISMGRCWAALDRGPCFLRALANTRLWAWRTRIRHL